MGRNSQSTCTWRVLFSPLGLMYIQAAIEKRSNYRAEIVDPVVEDYDYPDSKKC